MSPTINDLLNFFHSKKVSIVVEDVEKHRRNQDFLSLNDLKRITQNEFGCQVEEDLIKLAADNMVNTGQWKLQKDYFYNINLFKNVVENAEKIKKEKSYYSTIDKCPDHILSPRNRMLLNKFDGRVAIFDFAESLSEKGMMFYQQNRVEGYIPTKQKIFIAYKLPSIDHEIAHMVEMQDLKRCIQDDWGLVLGNENTTKQISAEQFFRWLVREARVWSIQDRLTDRRITSSFFSPFWKEAANEYLPFGRFNTEKHLQDWLVNFKQTTFDAYPFDRIVHDWDIRVNYIKNWMETK